MNIFGAFNFGRLIKTFLPGFVILIGLYLFIDESIFIASSRTIFLQWISQNATLLAFVSLPLSLICGIISNMIFFTFLTDKLVRNPYNKANADINKIQETIATRVNDRYSSEGKLPRELFEDYKKHIDLEFLLLPLVKLEKLIFLQESYWYYLEFQLNISLATVFFAVAAISWSAVHYSTLGFSPCSYFCLLVAFLLMVILVTLISLKASRLNYDRHRRKLLSLLIGAIHAPEDRE